MSDTMPDGMKGVLGWVLGVAIIAFVILILVIIFGNLQGNVGLGTTSNTFRNESMTFEEAGTIPTNAQGLVSGGLTNLIITNATDGIIVPTTNFTVTGVTIFGNESSEFLTFTVNVSYTVTSDSLVKIDADNVILNYTRGATNTSNQFPTIGTIIGIALLLLILIGLLIFVIRRMSGVAGVTGSVSNKGSSSAFSGSSRDFG